MTRAARAHGPQRTGPGWMSCTSSCSGRDGDRPAVDRADQGGARSAGWPHPRSLLVGGAPNGGAPYVPAGLPWRPRRFGPPDRHPLSAQRPCPTAPGAGRWSRPRPEGPTQGLATLEPVKEAGPGRRRERRPPGPAQPSRGRDSSCRKRGTSCSLGSSRWRTASIRTGRWGRAGWGRPGWPARRSGGPAVVVPQQHEQVRSGQPFKETWLGHHATLLPLRQARPPSLWGPEA